MAQTQMLEGTGEELQRLLQQFPKERFRLVHLTSPEHYNGVKGGLRYP